MMRKSAHLSLVTVLTAAVVAASMIAAPAQAQNYGRTFAISGFAGYNVASDIYTSYNDLYGQASIEMKNDFTWGGRLTGFTNDYSAVEFAYTRSSSDLAVNRGTTVPGFEAGSIAFDEYDLNFLVSQPTGNPRMWPYFTVGFGWTVTHPEIAIEGQPTPTSIDGNTLFAFNFGLGTMVEVNPNLALRLDARWRVTDTHITTSSGVYCDYWGYCWGYSSDWYNSGEFTAGLTYRMGSR